MAKGKVGREPTAGFTGNVSGQLKSREWGRKSERAPEMMDEEPAGVKRLSQDGHYEGASVWWCR